MAIHELHTGHQITFPVDKATNFLAGAALVRNAVTSGSVIAGKVVAADRSLSAAGTNPHTGRTFVGFSADDKQRYGVTMIMTDPVGANWYDYTTNSLITNNNGFYVGPKRALGDFYDESETNITDLTSGRTGLQGPRRGVGVYTSPQCVFITDQFAMSTVASGANGATQDDASVVPSFNVGDLLTFGSSTVNNPVVTGQNNAGKLVGLIANATTYAPAIARVDYFDAGMGLLYFTTL